MCGWARTGRGRLHWEQGLQGSQSLRGYTPTWPWLSIASRGVCPAALSRWHLLTHLVSFLCRCPDLPTGLPASSCAHVQEASLHRHAPCPLLCLQGPQPSPATPTP